VRTISYIVDSYRGVICPTRNFVEFAAYVSLFSQLVAGPIVRFRQIEEDLDNLASAHRERWFVLAAWWSMIAPNAFDIDQRWGENWGTRPRQRLVLAAALGAGVAIMAGTGSSPFLYFQF